MEYIICEPYLNCWIAFKTSKDARTYIGTMNAINSTSGLTDFQKRERLDALLALLPHRIRVLPMPIDLQP